MLSVSSEDASNRNSYLLILEIYQVQAFPETVYWFLTKLNRIWPYNPGFTPLSSVQLFVNPWTAAHQVPCPSPTPRACSNSCPLSQWCHPTISSSPTPPAFNLSQHQGPKSWSFSFSIIPSKEIPWLSSFRVDWLDLLAVQGTLKSLLQHHSSKASILRCSGFPPY